MMCELAAPHLSLFLVTCVLQGGNISEFGGPTKLINRALPERTIKKARARKKDVDIGSGRCGGARDRD
jgi:hypothetical protein